MIRKIKQLASDSMLPLMTLAAMCGFLFLPRLVRAAEDSEARELVGIALRAMGGEERLQAILSTAFKGIGHRYMLEQSERPEGPWLLDYFEISELRDFENDRLRQDIKSKGCNSTECWKSSAWTSPSTLVVRDRVAAVTNGEKVSAGRGSTVQSAEGSLALAPERVVLQAFRASGLRKELDVT